MAPLGARLRADLASACRRAYARGLVAGRSGNASARVAEGFLVTPSGACLGDVEARDLLLVDPDGCPLGPGRPTSELVLHLALYGVLPAAAILHTHSPAATALAVSGKDLEPPTTEAEHFLGTVPCVPFAPPGSRELAEAAAAAAPGRAALLLARHGVVAWGDDPLEAFFQAELVEEAARVALALRR